MAFFYSKKTHKKLHFISLPNMFIRVCGVNRTAPRGKGSKRHLPTGRYESGMKSGTNLVLLICHFLPAGPSLELLNGMRVSWIRSMKKGGSPFGAADLWKSDSALYRPIRTTFLAHTGAFGELCHRHGCVLILKHHNTEYVVMLFFRTKLRRCK